MEIKFYLTGKQNILCSYNINSNKVTLTVDDSVIILEPQQVEILLNTINLNKGVLGKC